MPPLLNYDSPADLKQFLESRNLGMQKKFGQNFLINPSARKKLVDSLEVQEGDSVWEIGPGLGAMTAELLDRGCSVKAFEIDKGFVKALEEFFGGRSGFEIIAGDVLKTWKNETIRAPYLFGNLPYNIGAAIIADFIEAGCLFSRIVVTVQREVAQRMAAKPGDRDYSSFSVLCSMAYRVSPLMVLKGASFYPAPHVDSQAVRLDMKAGAASSSYPSILSPMVRALFSSRRKTILNNLQTFLASGIMKGVMHPRDLAGAALDSSGIPYQERAERLSLEQFTVLAQYLENAVGNS